MRKQQRICENYRKMAQQVAFDQKTIVNTRFGYLGADDFEALKPLQGDCYQVSHVFHAPAEPIETYKADIVRLAHLCNLSPFQFPQQHPHHFAWTLNVLTEDEAHKLRENGVPKAKSGDLHLRARTGNFEDYANFAYALSPDEFSRSNNKVSRRVTTLEQGYPFSSRPAELRIETAWAGAVRRTLDEAKVSYRHMDAPDGAQIFDLPNNKRAALILEGMLVREAFASPHVSFIYPPLSPIFARLPVNFGAVTLQKLQEARKKTESGKRKWFRRPAKVDSYRSPR